MPRTQAGESAISRAVRIVEAFGTGETVLTVTEIARRTGLHLATASRIVEELVSLGWLSRDERRRVRVGVRLWEVVNRASPTLGLREAAMPVMEDLHQVMGHHTQLAVLEGSDVLFVERLTAPGGVVNYSRVAGRIPAHASSSGVVLLAHAPAEVAERVLAAPLARYTAHTVTDPEALRRLLAQVRLQGFAALRGHVHEDAAGIAVPIRSPEGAVVAALSLVVPNDDAVLTRVPILQAASLSVTRAMGRPAPPAG